MDAQPQPKTCATCAHLIGVRHQTQYHEGWVCGAEENIANRVLNLVSGVLEPQYRFRQCLEARKPHTEAFPPDMEGQFTIRGSRTYQIKRGFISLSCGPEGLWWKLYEQPKYAAPSTLGKVSAEALLSELETLK